MSDLGGGPPARPLPLTEGRLMMLLQYIVDGVSTPSEALTGYQPATLLQIQDAINQFFDHERAARSAGAQEAGKP